MENIAFIDLEVDVSTEKVLDFGVTTSEGLFYHGGDSNKFKSIISKYNILCGHNIVNHDSKYINKMCLNQYEYIDTLTISPIIYPTEIHHNLLKDDKLCSYDINNPLNDSKNAKSLFYKELNAFNSMPIEFRNIMGTLLYKDKYFSGFFKFVSWDYIDNLESEIKKLLKDKICDCININNIIVNNPIELAYAIALVNIDDKTQNIAPWVNMQFPEVNNVLNELRLPHCNKCEYCETKYSLEKRLNDIFGYSSFRTYNGEPLQQRAAQAALEGKSLLAVFPTGGGKSITFQLPALIMGETCKGLTIVISPLQSLMKDQVDSLNSKNITDAVTINGLLNSIERKEAIDRVLYKGASLLYISPELLRNKTILKIIMSRNISRIVIDEAHCFSTWGQDFRVDYLFLADFIKKIQKEKNLQKPIPISCFTATAKQKVIADIKSYFRDNLDIELELYATSSARHNLRYSVELKKDDEEKYNSLRKLLTKANCPTIVYASRTKTTLKLADKLVADGFNARAFNGKMEKEEKINNQEAFINDQVDIIVATSAFGMGVDKSNVKLVVHYDISDSLENYIQEAGRAGRDANLNADCVIYFNEDDLDKHFSLLNQTKLNMKDISSIWKAIKKMTNKSNRISCSALEIARQAGWDDSITDIETRVKTAISVLENSKYLVRSFNCPRVFATSIKTSNVIEANKIIEQKGNFDEENEMLAKRIMSALISSKKTHLTKKAEAESRIDYLADNFGVDKYQILNIINRFIEIGLLSDSNDMIVHINTTEINKLKDQLNRFISLENFLLKYISEKGSHIEVNLKELNELATNEGLKKTSVKNIRTILYFWEINGLLNKTSKRSEKVFEIDLVNTIDDTLKKIENRNEISIFIFDYLTRKAYEKENGFVEFSTISLMTNYNDSYVSLINSSGKILVKDIENSIMHLSKLGILRIEGGFLVLYNAMQIEKIVVDNKIQFKKDDYELLKNHYQLKVEQIHMVGEFANMMISDYNNALQYMSDYFELEHSEFIKKYFKGEKKGQIKRNITPKQYDKLIKELSQSQRNIIDESEAKYICVLAGPGSGKTKVLVHKLASLLLLEDVKTEQLLMLTFSRAAANEFKSRLVDLIGNAAHYVDIKTFHSYCFDILGRIGDESEFRDVIKIATDAIKNDEIEESKISKLVLVIDEAQDIGKDEFNLINALIDANPEMKVIAVGDDDQNIYGFRGSNSNYLKLLTSRDNSKVFELLDNYRTVNGIIKFTNQYCKTIKNRMKNKPINFVRNDYGKVTVIEYTNEFFERSVVDMIKKTIGSKKIAILTETNEQAYITHSLLMEAGVNAKLIQNNDGFNLINLLEIRYLLKYIEKNSSTPIIDKALWNASLELLKKEFKESNVLNDIVDSLISFEKNNKDMYISDLKMFLTESKYEDVTDFKQFPVVVSTIHKSKGREFDIVHIINKKKGLAELSEDDKRVLYVGMTRAKNYLYIHTCFDSFKKWNFYCEYKYDCNEYEEVLEKTILLSHNSINLNSFKNAYKKETLEKYRSGQKLIYSNNYIYSFDGVNEICILSNKMIEYLEKEKEKGYFVVDAKVNFVLSWLDKEDVENKKRWLIILPKLVLKKIDNNDKIIENDNIILRRKLKQCRFNLMKKHNQNNAYIIFNDETLEEIIKYKPINIYNLRKIKGIGLERCNKYGKEIINCINNHINKQ